MLRYRFALAAPPLAVALLAWSVGSGAARASTINPNATTTLANYRLTTSADFPAPNADIAGPQVVAMVVPPGGVVPPTNADGTQGSPLTVLSDSSGFDAGQLVVALKDATDDAGNPEQLLGLVFFGQGLRAGGVLNFALSIDKALAGNPPKLVSSTPGVTITSLSPPTNPNPDPGPGNGGGNGGGVDPDPEVHVPEPVTFLVWSAIACAIALRGRASRRARVMAQAA